MNIYKAGKLGNLRSITLFHAMARLGYEGLVITEPSDTYVSVGYFDKTQDIVDLARCEKLGIPVIRREVGGGAVLLHENQIFYQLILPRDKVPFKVQEAYRIFRSPFERLQEARSGRRIQTHKDIVVKKKQAEDIGAGAGT